MRYKRSKEVRERMAEARRQWWIRKKQPQQNPLRKLFVTITGLFLMAKESL